MEEILVTTIDNKVVDKSLCRKMGGVYYLKGDVNIENSGECYYINNKYYKYNTGYIFYDHSVKQYVLKNSVEKIVEKGVIDIDDKGNLTFGSFSLNNNDYVELKSGISKYICLNEDIVKDNKFYLECLEDGIYYLRTLIDSFRFVKPVKCNREYKYSLSYDSRNLTSKVKDIYSKQYEPVYHHILEKLKCDITKGLSFGVEYETTAGVIPNRYCNKLGLIPLRDGSISGLEYVTIPLEGNKGIQTILDINKELNKRTSFDSNCSLHLHIGNIPRTEEFFLALFKILFLIQDEMFSMFPFHKKENYDIKRKHYTKPLPIKETMLLFDSSIKTKEDIKKNFNILYKFLSTGEDYNKAGGTLDKIKNHPSDPGGNSKWNIKTRYYWVNLIPLLFGNKQTVEFRIHTPTYDSNKIMNYMLTCFAIINYTKRNQDDILKNFNNYINIDLNQIVFDEYYNDLNNFKVVNDLQRYYSLRKQYFFNRTKEGDFLANEDNFIYSSDYVNWNNNKMMDENKTLKGFKKLSQSVGIPIPVFEENNNFNAERIRQEIRDEFRNIRIEGDGFFNVVGEVGIQQPNIENEEIDIEEEIEDNNFDL